MKNWLKENRGFLVLLLCLGVFRTAIADWNPIPSGSMRPTLLEGDVVLVNRLAYDLKVPLTDISLARISDPQRGDVVTFSSPRDGTRLIKRIVALPGDVIELRDEVLIINGRAAQYVDRALVQEPLEHAGEIAALRATERIDGAERRVQFLPSVSAMRSVGPIVVPAGSYFMMGDNRDNSADSRYIGFVPRRLLIGHARRILVSADITGDWWRPRFERIGQDLR
jgi:signal peptidase I